MSQLKYVTEIIIVIIIIIITVLYIWERILN
jgi:hypothetical protein